MKPRRMWVIHALAAVVGVVLAGVAVAAWQKPRPTAAPKPFTDLNTALEGFAGWELLTPPPEPGPYRFTHRESMLGGCGGLTCSVRGDRGEMLEEVRLRGVSEYDQLVVVLETPSGRKTMAVMKRPR